MRLGKKLPWGHYAYAVVAETRGDRFEAERHLRDALFADPEHQPSKLRLAALSSSDNAIEDARNFIANAGPETTWRELEEAGELLLKGREFVDAMKAFEMAHKRADQAKGIERDNCGCAGRHATRGTRLASLRWLLRSCPRHAPQ